MTMIEVSTYHDDGNVALGWFGGLVGPKLRLHEVTNAIANVDTVAKDYGLHIDQLPLTMLGLKHSCN